MAEVAESRDFRIDADWVDGSGVATPELAATWCRLALWVGDRCLTLIEDTRGGVRHSVYTSAYPLAEWIAYNWWSLRGEVRASGTPTSSWYWSNVDGNPWLRRHNFRGASGGMPWPDLTVVPEGAVSRVVWQGGPGVCKQPVRFIGAGNVYVDSRQIMSELGHFVTQVVDRLEESSVPSPLAKEWHALRELDEEEAAFASAAARLGLDPFDMTDQATNELVALAESLDQPLLDEFLDSADPQKLPAASAWLTEARRRARTIKVPPESVTGLRLSGQASGFDGRPFERGYALARAIRRELGLAATAQMKVNNFVSETAVGLPAAGLEGLASVRSSDKVVLVLPRERLHPTAVRFVQARALGVALVTDRSESLLDPASTDLVKETRAFAAELLAPADGIREYLRESSATTEQTLDGIASRFDTSSWLVQLQYANQVVAH